MSEIPKHAISGTYIVDGKETYLYGHEPDRFENVDLDWCLYHVPSKKLLAAFSTKQLAWEAMNNQVFLHHVRDKEND